ncbi:MAG: hypothetical protein JSR46_12530, partial [Verrucomicrobia bacterium]|nr:hypothetical protein [Verrucomicrobiota bacterium]
DLQIQNTPKRVHNDPQYWPWGWLSSDRQELHGDEGYFITQQDKAQFLLAYQPGFFKSKRIELPISADNPLRALFDSSIVMINTPRHIILDDHLGQAFVLTMERNAKDGTMKLECEGMKGFKDKMPPPLAHNAYHPAMKEKVVHEKSLLETPSTEANNPKFAGDLLGMGISTSRNVEVCKELLAIRQPNLFQIDATLDYVEEHFEKLDDRDFFLQLRANLFESDYLLQALRHPVEAERVIDRLDRFFRSMNAQAVEMEKCSLAADLLWIKSSVQSYIDFVSEERGEPLKPLFSYDEITQLVQNVTQDGGRKYEKHYPAVFQAAVAAGRDQEKLSQAQLGTLFMANVLFKQFPVTANRLSLTEADVRASQQKISTYFTRNKGITTECLQWSGGQALLEKVFPNIKGPFSANRARVAGVIVSADNRTQIAFSSGELVSTDPTLRQTYKNPLDATAQQHFVKADLYSDKEVEKYLRCYKDGAITYIRDTKNNRDFVLKEGSIYAKMPIEGKEVWALHITHRAHKVKIGLEFEKKYHERLVETEATGKTTYLCDRKTLEPGL